MTLALDGSANTIWSRTAHGSASLTTTSADDVIILIIANEKNTDDASDTTVTSVSDTAGLTWTLHKQFNWQITHGSVTRQDMEIWWAHAPSALTGDTITVTTANTSTNALAGLTDDSCFVAFGISGANFTSPFDTNVSIPASGADPSQGNSTMTRQVTGISTTSVDTMLISAMANSFNQTGTSITSPSGFTVVAQPNNTGGGLFEYLSVNYKVVNAQQSSLAVQEGSGQAWGMLVTAVKAAASEIDAGAAPVLGFSMAAALNIAQTITASMGLGFSEAATVDNETAQILAALALGFDLTVVLSGEKSVPVSYAMGMALAAVLTREVVEGPAFAFGFGMHVSFGGRNRQPVVNLLS